MSANIPSEQSQLDEEVVLRVCVEVIRTEQVVEPVVVNCSLVAETSVSMLRCGREASSALQDWLTNVAVDISLDNTDVCRVVLRRAVEAEHATCTSRVAGDLGSFSAGGSHH